MKTLRDVIEDAAWEMERDHGWGMRAEQGSLPEIDPVLIDVFTMHVQRFLGATAEPSEPQTEEEFTLELARMARRRLAEMGFTTDEY
jgi:hypothetical protein